MEVVAEHHRGMTTLRRPAVALGAALMIFALAPAASARPSEDAPTTLVTSLRSSGDPDGAGSASIRLRPAAGRVCATISWSGIEAPTAAHIHRVSDGFVLVDLTGAVTGGQHCVTAPTRTISRIAEHPRRYYVNVHNATYPAGAVQGTLHR
jgi:hypothetical protein